MHWTISIVYSVCFMYKPTHTSKQAGQTVEEMEASSPHPQPLSPSVQPSWRLGSDTAAARPLPHPPAFDVAQSLALTVTSSSGTSQGKKRKLPSTKASAYRPAATTTNADAARPHIPTSAPQLNQDAAGAKSKTHKSSRKSRGGSGGAADGKPSGSSSLISSSKTKSSHHLETAKANMAGTETVVLISRTTTHSPLSSSSDDGVDPNAAMPVPVVNDTPPPPPPPPPPDSSIPVVQPPATGKICKAKKKKTAITTSKKSRQAIAAATGVLSLAPPPPPSSLPRPPQSSSSTPYLNPPKNNAAVVAAATPMMSTTSMTIARQDVVEGMEEEEEEGKEIEKEGEGIEDDDHHHQRQQRQQRQHQQYQQQPTLKQYHLLRRPDKSWISRSFSSATAISLPPPLPAPKTRYLLHTKEAYAIFLREFLQNWGGKPILPAFLPPPHSAPTSSSKLIRAGKIKTTLPSLLRPLTHLQLLLLARHEWSTLSLRRKRRYFKSHITEARGGIYPTHIRSKAEAAACTAAAVAQRQREDARPATMKEMFPFFGGVGRGSGGSGSDSAADIPAGIGGVWRGPPPTNLVALVMREERCNVAEARERVRKMTERERRRRKEEVREGKERYEKEVEEYCVMWQLPVVVGGEEGKGMEEERERDEEAAVEEEQKEDDDDEEGNDEDEGDGGDDDDDGENDDNEENEGEEDVPLSCLLSAVKGGKKRRWTITVSK